MHTDDTADILDQNTTTLGFRLRAFQHKVCSAYETRELKKEAEQRKRRAQKATEAAVDKGKGKARGIGKGKAKAKADPSSSHAEPDQTPTQATSGEGARRPKTYSLSTFKLHSLGDYCRYIRSTGSTDGYNTRSVRTP